MIHVFIGTKAQYIKTAPLLRLMDERGTGYRLIDSGQHAALSVWMRGELGVRDPDLSLGGKRDVSSIPQAVMWMMGFDTTTPVPPASLRGGFRRSRRSVRRTRRHAFHDGQHADGQASRVVGGTTRGRAALP